MKIRTGFVSNSSSSSFVAVGFNLAKDGKTPDFFSILELFGYHFEDELKRFEDDYRKNIEKYKEAEPNSWGRSYYTEEKLQNEIAEYKAEPNKLMSDAFYERIRDEFDFVVMTNTEDGAPTDDDFIICEYLSDFTSEDYMESNTVPFSQIEKRFEALEELRKRIAPDKEMTLYTGTRMC